MLSAINQWILQQLEEYGLWALGIFSYTEAIFHPIPVDPILIGMISLKQWTPEMIFFTATLSSCLGGVTSYILGKWLGKPIFLKFFKEEQFQKGQEIIQKWGIWSILIAAVTPIPFKIVTWMAGILQMNFIVFFIAQTFGRAVRFSVIIWGFEYFFSII